jgi:valyl-tRNA synthetase
MARASCATLKGMITSETVEQACSEVSEYNEEQMASEFERFFKAQPNLCDFVVEVTTDSTQRIQELSLFLSYMVFRAVEKARPPDLPSVTSENIEAAFRDSEKWIEKLNEANTPETQLSIMTSFAKDSEPYLLQYVISEINEPLEDGSQLADEQKGEVFFVLKTVIATLSGNPLESEKT